MQRSEGAPGCLVLLHDSVLVPLSVDAAYETDSLDDPHDSIQSSSLLFPSDNDRNLGESGQHGEKGEAASSSCPESCPPLPEDSEAQSIKLSSNIRRFLNLIGSDRTSFWTYTALVALRDAEQSSIQYCCQTSSSASGQKRHLRVSTPQQGALDVSNNFCIAEQ